MKSSDSLHATQTRMPDRLATLDAWLGRPSARLAIIALSLLAGWLIALPHLGEAIWQDEATTISAHVSRGILDPFRHYATPNNHVGFTAMLAAWIGLFSEGLGIPDLRTLPLLLSLAAIPLAYAASLRLGGATCAALSTLAFATSAVTENFATQLRGYGPSWPFFAAALLCALSVGRHRLWLLGYLLACLGANAMLPTNVVFLSVIGAAGWVHLWISNPGYAGLFRSALLLVLLPPLTLLVAYAGLWQELVQFSSMAFSQWRTAELLVEWLRGSLSNLLWAIPLIGAGLAMALPLVRPGKLRTLSPSVACSVVLACGFIAGVWLMPNTPFPRTLVPYLPVWIASLSCLILHALRTVGRGSAAWAAGGAVALSALLLPSGVVAPCRDSPSSGDKSQYDLCYQYFRDQYNPSAVLDVWASQPAPLPIVSGFEGYSALRILGSPAQVYVDVAFPGPLVPRPLIVAHDRSELTGIATRIGLSPAEYHLQSDTGYFKVYRSGGLR